MIKIKNKHKSKPESNDIYIGRGSILGNPFTHLNLQNTKAEFHCESRDEAIKNYEDYINDKIKNNDLKICKEIDRLCEIAKEKDINLVCFCSPKKCHGDIIKKIIEKRIFNLENLD